MMIIANLILFSLFTLLLQTSPSHANNCIPFSCGIIHNITYPFRLKHDPQHCGLYELSCENNIPSIYLNSHKYNIKAINHNNFTIRLVDASINNNTCSFPNSSLYPYNLTTMDFLQSYPFLQISNPPNYSHDIAWPLNFMTCQYLLKNSSFSSDITDCASNPLSSLITRNRRHKYVKIGDMMVSNVEHMCRVDIIVMTSWRFSAFNKTISISEIHHSLAYGFELSWFCAQYTDGKRAFDCIISNSDSDKDGTRPGRAGAGAPGWFCLSIS